MNIAFDATAVMGSLSRNRGIGNYAFSQFKNMIKRDANNQYYLINFYDELHLGDVINHSANLHEYRFYTGKEYFILSDTRFSVIIGDIIRNFIEEHQIDIFYITSPFEANICVYQKEWFANTKVVTTVYDIIPYVMKEHYLPNKSIYEAYMERVNMLRWMDRYLVISQSVKDDMINYLHFDADKIDVIYGAADESFCQVTVTDDEKSALSSKYDIKGPFVLCTGGDDERKNLEGLIIAYSKLPAHLIANHQLVIVCKLTAPSKKRYSEMIRKNRVIGRVILTNYIPNEELLQLYNLAHLLVFPSKYEGFGLPVVEAWACGTPVLTSNNSSLGEIAGDAAVLVDPFRVEDITRGLITALTNTDLSALQIKAKERLKQFQWDVVADLALTYLEKEYRLLTTKEEAFVAERTKPKLAFFTPLPPVKSGISDYSVDILNVLCDYFDIDVFIDNGYQPEHSLNPAIHMFHHKKFVAKKYQQILYQMGNSEYHTYMYPYIMKFGGTLVLHDYNMHAVAYHVSVWKKSNLALYRKYLLEDYPADYVNEYLHAIKRVALAPKLVEVELNGFVSNYASKIIVHSDEAKAKLLERDIGRNVKKINSYAKIEPLIDSSIAKKVIGVPDDVVVFSSFGHIHQTKRALPILKAFHRLCMQYEQVHYYFVGLPDVGIKDELYLYIQQNHLEDKVTITGYIELDQFKSYIDATDICVNLRYPSNGETSGSLMRILAKGKCVMINDIGSFSEIPSECCVKLPSVETMADDQEIERILQEFEQLLSDKDKINQICTNARKYAETHLDIKKIVKQYASFINDGRVPALSEQLLRIIEQEVHNKCYTSEQVEELVHMLGYSKNYKADDDSTC